MITYSKLGHPRRGNLGNQLFQIAATIGMATLHGHKYAFPAWAHSQALANPLPTAGRLEAWELPERGFNYQEENIEAGENYDLDGWRQSERYWEHASAEVREALRFAPRFIEAVKADFARALERPAIAISVRRGDFVNNPNYDQVPIKFYLLALFSRIPDWKNYNIIIFSDDMPFCRVHFEGLPNVFFGDGSAISQLALMSLCQHFVISNSTFSWWGAWLGEKPGSIVVRPPRNFAGQLARDNDERDFWPDRWTPLEYRGAFLDLRDVTFTIPVYIDHRHRLENLRLSVEIIRETIDTNFIICEQGSSQANVLQGVEYMREPGRFFHRTKMLNDMAKKAATDIVVNWDADVFVPPAQLWLAAERIREGQDMVYPYDGRFARVPRVWLPELTKSKDVGIFGDTEFKGKHGKPLPTTSVGGAIFFNRIQFLNGGGENEYMISFGPEDWERFFRFKALGYEISRVDGSLYHLDHWIGPNSSTRNPFFRHNHKELDDMRALSTDQLVNYVSSWPWRP